MSEVTSFTVASVEKYDGSLNCFLLVKVVQVCTFMFVGCGQESVCL